MARYDSTNSIYAIERKAAFIAAFLSNDPSHFSFTNLRSRITSSRGTPTTLKLSQKRLAWGEKNPSRTERSTSAMVPYDSAELASVKEIFVEPQHPCVLLCVIRTTSKPGFGYEIMGFRLHSEHDVHLFINLFTTLTQHPTVGVFRAQSSSTLFNRDEPSYSLPQTLRVRAASTKRQHSVSMPFSSGTIGPPNASFPQSQMDGHVFRAMDGTARGTQHYNTTDSLRNSSERHSESRVHEIQPRSANFSGTRPGHSSVRMRPETEMRRPADRAIDRTFVTRNVGVMADLDSSIPRSRPGDYLPLEGELSSKHERIYIYEDGSKMGEVFCQTNLRSPPTTVSRRNGGSLFVKSNGQNVTATRSRVTDTSGLSRRSMSQDFAPGVDETDLGTGRQQRNRPSMQRRMTLVDNGVVKVTVEEYQDPAEKTAEELSPASQSSDQTIDYADTHFDRRELNHKDVNRLDAVPGAFGRSSRLDSTDGHRSRQPRSHDSSSSLKMRSPTMTSTVQRVFRRRSVPRSTSDTLHVSHPVATRVTGRRSTYREDPVDRPYTTQNGAVVHQSRPVVIRNESTTYSIHRPYAMHDPVYQSEPVIIRRQPMNSEKRRHHVQGSQQTYETQPVTIIRAQPTTSPVRHRSIAHESVYHSQPIAIRTEPITSPVRQHRSSTYEPVYQSRPTQIRQKSTNSVYGHEQVDISRDPRNEYRLIAGTPGPGTIRQSRSRHMP